MKSTRRTYLKGAGALTVLIAGSGVWRAYDQGVLRSGQGPAYEPWESWDTDASHGPLAVVRAAILAANPHSTQPWLFKVTDRRVELLATQASQLATVRQLIELNYGVSILPGISIDNDSGSSIRHIKLRGERSAREVVLATAKNRYLSPAAECFVSIVKEQYQAR